MRYAYLLIIPLLFVALSASYVPEEIEAPIVRVYDNEQATVTYPILVVASNNATATTQASFTFDTASPNRIYIRASNLRYNGKGRVRLNNGTAKSWVTFNESSTTCAVPENYGCMAVNAYSTVRFTASVPSDWLTGDDPWVSGSNTFDFQMVVPGSAKVFVDNGHGYRILWMDALESGDGYTGSSGVTQYWKDHGGDNVLSKTGSPLHMTDTIAWEDYSSASWRESSISGYLGNSSHESAGQTYFTSATITDNLGNATSATCSDCHALNGADLSYYRIENEFIIETVRARGGTLEEGQQVAAYIRSHDTEFTLSNGTTSVDPVGYPWCSPYQPGSSYVTGNLLSESDTFYWPAGSCEYLDYDSESAPEWRVEIARWDVTDIDADFRYENIPIARQLPPYHGWLPIRHMMDYAPSQWSPLVTPLAEYYAATGANQISTEAHQFQTVMQTSEKVGQNGATVQQWGVNRIDTRRLGVMKNFDMSFFHTGDWQNAYASIYNANQGVPSQARSWPMKQSSNSFQVAPHVTSPSEAISGWEFGEVGDVRGQVLANHLWYQLTRYISHGWAPESSAQVPNDMQYQISFFFDKQQAPYRFTGTIIDQLDMLWKVNASGGRATQNNANSGLTRARGWTPNVMNVHAWGSNMWDDGGFTYMSAADQARAVNAVAQAWYDVISAYGPNYDDPIIERGTQRYQWEPKGYVTPTTGPFGVTANEFHDTNNFYRWIDKANDIAGSDKTLLANLAEMFEDFYGSSVNWSALVDGNPGPAPVTLAVTQPSGGESYTQGDLVTVQVTTSGTDSLLAFLQKGGVTVETATDSVESALAFTWALDSTLTVGEDYRFGVSSASGGTVTAYSGLFTVAEYTAPVIPDSFEVGGIGSLTRKDWSDGASGDLLDIDVTADKFTSQTGTPFALASRDYGPVLWRPLIGYSSYEMKVDTISASHGNSYQLFDLREDTVATSSSFGIAFYPTSYTGDSLRARLTIRKSASDTRQYLPDTSGSYVSTMVSTGWCFSLSHADGVGYAWYNENCQDGGEVLLGSYDFGDAWSPEYMGLSLSPRTGASGSGMYAVIDRGLLRRRQNPNTTSGGPVLTPVTWSNYHETNALLVIATIPSEFYPDNTTPSPGGACFYKNGVFNRCDETGPQEAGTGVYQFFPAVTAPSGTVLRVEWTDLQGIERYHEFTVP